MFWIDKTLTEKDIKVSTCNKIKLSRKNILKKSLFSNTKMTLCDLSGQSSSHENFVSL